jgi:hypothetical protein
MRSTADDCGSPICLPWQIGDGIRGATMSEPTYDELKKRLADLEAKQKRTGNMSFKVSDKGGVSVYGLGRFPVTLYYEQWMKLLDKAEDLRAFLEENKAGLKMKE